jgi:putative phosphoribosyl transferase
MNFAAIFHDRADAGRALAKQLDGHAGRHDVVVLALPRGGVPVGYHVAEALGAPLDIFVVRKLGTPGHRELAMGAIASGGVRVLNDDVVRWLNIRPEQIESVAREEEQELIRREAAYKAGRPPVSLKDRVVILVDDGLATGSTMKAAVQAVKQHGPSRVIVAVPVGAPETCRDLREYADEVVCVSMPERFSAVGQWYERFDQTSDDEVRELLTRAAERSEPSMRTH